MNRSGSVIVFFHWAKNIPPSRCFLVVSAEKIRLENASVFSENNECLVSVKDVWYRCIIMEIDEDATVDEMKQYFALNSAKMEKTGVRWANDFFLRESKKKCELSKQQPSLQSVQSVDASILPQLNHISHNLSTSTSTHNTSTSTHNTSTSTHNTSTNNTSTSTSTDGASTSTPTLTHDAAIQGTSTSTHGTSISNWTSQPAPEMEFEEDAHPLQNIVPAASPETGYLSSSTSSESGFSSVQSAPVSPMEWLAHTMRFRIPDCVVTLDGHPVCKETFFDEWESNNGSWIAAVSYTVDKLMDVSAFLETMIAPMGTVHEDARMKSIFTLILFYRATKGIVADEMTEEDVRGAVFTLQNRRRCVVTPGREVAQVALQSAAFGQL